MQWNDTYQVSGISDFLIVHGEKQTVQLSVAKADLASKKKARCQSSN